MKRLFSFFMSLLLLIAVASNSAMAYAYDTASNDEEQSILAGDYAILVENGVSRIITREEAELLKSQIWSITPSIGPGGLARETGYKFTPDRTISYADEASISRVSPIVGGPAEITKGYSNTIECSWSAESGVTLTPDMVNTIAYSVNASVSASSMSTFSTQFPVPAGRYGAVFFTHIVIETTGLLEVFRNWGYSRYTNVTFVGPTSVDGFADGIYDVYTASSYEALL